MKLDSTISAVVTGGASGLGEACARALAAQGVSVALFDLNTARGETVAQEINGIFCHVDICSDNGVDEAFAKARKKNGQERILVNCAGIGSAFKTASRSPDKKSIQHFPLEHFNQTLQVNLIGTFRCIAKSAAGMLSLPMQENDDRGVIINTASVAAEDGQVGQAAYSASKAGIVGMTLPIARDLMNEGVRINTILPGTFDTPLLHNAPQTVKDGLAAAVPFPKRLGKPEEYASFVLELCRNGYFNGESIRLDGAIRMQPR